MKRRGSRVPAWVWDLIVFVVLSCLSAVPYVLGHPHPLEPLAVALTLASAAALFARRRLPIAVLAFGLAAFSIGTVLGLEMPGPLLAVAVSLFTIATRTNRRMTIATTAIAILVITVAGLIPGWGEGWTLQPIIVQNALGVALAAAAGDATRSRRETITSITERAERAEQTRESEARRRVTQERLSIARDLHDAVAHQISVVSLNAGVASSALETRPEVAREALATIRVASREVLREIGDLLQMLRASDDDTDDAMAVAPQWGLERIDELVQRFEHAGLAVSLQVGGDPSVLPGAVDIVAFRVIQEALTNAHKHGSNRAALVAVDVEADSVHIVVTNPAVAQSSDAVAGATARIGHGLLGLRERVASVRGEVETGMVAGQYRVDVRLPVVREVPA